MTGLSLSDKPGAFEGYASLFGVADLSRDIVMRGAFQNSLASKNPIRLLWQHDAGQPLGIWTEVFEDRRGLFCRGELNLNVQRARELQALLKQGAIDGLSIGYKTRKARRDPSTGARLLLDVDLWEISLVSFPLLPQARVTAVKAETRQACRSHAALMQDARLIFKSPNQTRILQ